MTAEWIKKMWYIHTMDSVMIDTHNSMDKSQKQLCEGKTLHPKDTYCMIPFIRCLIRGKEYVTELRTVVVCGEVRGLGTFLRWCIHICVYMYALTHIYIVYIVLYKLYSLLVVFVPKVYTFVTMQRTVP